MEQQIARIKIFPGDVEIKTGEQVVFNAIAFDQDDNAVNGPDVNGARLVRRRTRRSLFHTGPSFRETPANSSSRPRSWAA